MSILQSSFEAAVQQAKQLPYKPEPKDLLQLYALFKQSTEGDNTSTQPSFTDIVARAKWDAWQQCQGMAKETAMQQYLDLVKALQEKSR